MNKSYLLIICLLLTSFTGCLDDFISEEVEITTDAVEDEDNSQIDETKDESDNTVDETNTTIGETNNTVDNNQTDFQPETKDELKTAVDEWIDDSDSASSTYGDINTWDTSLITDMSYLFHNKPTFNGDISDWDVSCVTDM